jgi:hypothetical protein
MTKMTRAIAEEAFNHGVTPLEAMLDNTRFAHEGAISLQAFVLTICRATFDRHVLVLDIPPRRNAATVCSPIGDRELK